MIQYLLHAIGWALLSIVKFLIVPFAMILKPDIGESWNWIETIIITASGASVGVYVFYHFGNYIFSWFDKKFSSQRKKITKKNRFFVRLKQKRGLKGLMLISGLISVPLAAVLAARLFRHDNTVLAKIVLAFWIWAIALSSIAWMMKKTGLSF